jgi:hypothetical protein
MNCGLANRHLLQAQVGQAQSTVLSIFTIAYAMAAPWWWRALQGPQILEFSIIFYILIRSF